MENKNEKNIEDKPVLPNRKKLVLGFTLIELLVSTSIFVMIMLSAMGSLFVLLNAAKNSRALRFSIDNVNFAMESMSRSIRMGTNYYCLSSGTIDLGGSLDETSDCPDGGKFIAFIPQGVTDSRIGYIWKKRDNNSGTSTVERCSVDGCVEIVSENVNVEKLTFFVNGARDEDKQASVYIVMKGIVMVKDEPIPFSIQTMASMRNF